MAHLKVLRDFQTFVSLLKIAFESIDPKREQNYQDFVFLNLKVYFSLTQAHRYRVHCFFILHVFYQAFCIQTNLL
jgi:hypothetical protein